MHKHKASNMSQHTSSVYHQQPQDEHKSPRQGAAKPQPEATENLLKGAYMREQQA